MGIKKFPFLFLSVSVNLILAERCTTPDNKEGQCISLLSCPEVVDAFANVKKGSEGYLRQFICENVNEKEVKVCCDLSSNFKKPGDRNSILEKYASKPPEVDLAEVYQCDTEKYPRQDNSTLQLAEIRGIYLGHNKESTICLGTLINSRYVLTAAECFAQDKKKFTIVAVRFKVGLKNDDSFKYYGIEEEIPHPFYNVVAGLNNIALIRIHRTVLKGDDIQPVCLRLPSLAILPEAGANALASGKVETRSYYYWNTTTTKLISGNTCKETLEGEIVTPYTMCTTDIQNDTEVKCTSLPGTPVTFFYPFSGTWIAGVSSSRTACGNGLPNLYTEVFPYLDWILENMKPWPVNNEMCSTVHGELGGYIPLRYCPAVMDKFANPEKGSEEHLRKDIYDMQEFTVCCNLAKREIDPADVQNQNINIPKEFERLKQFCGFQQNDGYSDGSDNITISEFPWIAYIALRIPGEYEPDHPQCIGSIINSRYVLTVAFCIETYHVNIVRLGDFSAGNKTDCVTDAHLDIQECSEFQDYGIEEKIIHPFYVHSASANNLALLRLNRTIIFTDYIRPICLPLPNAKKAKPGDNLYTSGFGYDTNGIFHELKKKTSTVLISNDRCREEIHKTYTIIHVHPYVMCSSEPVNNTEFACGYDDGGPLMSAQRRKQWQIEGVLNSVIRCGGKEPLRYTRVSKYIKWIISNIKP